jgi:tmRNA-binding protein
VFPSTPQCQLQPSVSASNGRSFSSRYRLKCKGYALIPLSLYWQRGRTKLDLGLAKGKKQHDKRAAEKDRDWKRQKEKILKF